MRPALVPLAALTLLTLLATVAAPARADELRLSDGEVLHGTVESENAQTIAVRLPDGSLRLLHRDEIVERRTHAPSRLPTPPAAILPAPPSARPSAPAAHATAAVTSLTAIRDEAREGLAARARTGAPALATLVPVRAQGRTYALTPEPRRIDLATARYRNATVDAVAAELWQDRGSTAEDRFRALERVAGTIAWIEAEVVSLGAGSSPEVEIELRSSVARGGRHVRLGRRVKPHEKLRLPAALVLDRDEAARFLSGSGDTLARWPFDAVLLVAEVPHAASASPTAARVATRALEERVRAWLRGRRALRCHACGGTRAIACEACGGKGTIEQTRIDAANGDSGTVRIPCASCDGKGSRACQACEDGVSEVERTVLLRTFGSCGRPLAGFLEAGVQVELDPSGTTATASALVRLPSRAHAEPTLERTRWRRDARGTWRLAGLGEGGVDAAGEDTRPTSR